MYLCFFSFDSNFYFEILISKFEFYYFSKLKSYVSPFILFIFMYLFRSLLYNDSYRHYKNKNSNAKRRSHLSWHVGLLPEGIVGRADSYKLKIEKKKNPYFYPPFFLFRSSSVSLFVCYFFFSFLLSLLVFFPSLMVFNFSLSSALSDFEARRSGEFIPCTTSKAVCSSANDR